ALGPVGVAVRQGLELAIGQLAGLVLDGDVGAELVDRLLDVVTGQDVAVQGDGLDALQKPEQPARELDVTPDVCRQSHRCAASSRFAFIKGDERRGAAGQPGAGTQAEPLDEKARFRAGCNGVASRLAAQRPAGATRQPASPTSSATSRAPRRSAATPTGRPIASPFSLRKPVSTSCGGPSGRPSRKGTKMTLYPDGGLRFHEPCWPMIAPLRHCGSRSPV